VAHIVFLFASVSVSWFLFCHGCFIRFVSYSLLSNMLFIVVISECKRMLKYNMLNK
jgi:hypothetical protein